MTRRNIAKDTAAGIIEDAIEVIYMLNYIGPLPDYPQTTVDKRWPQFLNSDFT